MKFSIIIHDGEMWCFLVNGKLIERFAGLMEALKYSREYNMCNRN